jgi:hypothetical protein
MNNLSDRLHFRAATMGDSCPLCNHEKYCWIGYSENSEAVRITCQWTTEAPEGWHSKGTSTDGRPIYERNGFRRRRKKYPNIIELETAEYEDVPEWQPAQPKENINFGDLVNTGHPKAKPIFFLGWQQSKGSSQYARCAASLKAANFEQVDSKLVTHAVTDPQTGDHEQVIEYLYPNDDGSPLGMVRRRQWTDRRHIYRDSRNSPAKSKQVLPYRWKGKDGKGEWTLGAGRVEDWPLYREAEAIAEIERGGIVFAVGGEPCVEALRSWGLVATSPQGGEMKYRCIIDALLLHFKSAKDAGKKPILVCWPDNDITGEDKFGHLLVRDAQAKAIPAVALNPTEVWPKCPPGGDAADWAKAESDKKFILKALTGGVDAAIERQEMSEATEELRKAWNAPSSNDGELGRWKKKKGGDDEEDSVTFIPQTNFDFQVEMELASEDGGGLLLSIQRSDDRERCRVFLKSSDYTSLNKFEDSLKRALGSNIVCTLTINEVKALIRARLLEYHRNRKGKLYRLIDRIGQQDDGVWVFQHGQLDKRGNPTSENETLWVWNAQMIKDNNLPSPTIVEHRGGEIRDLCHWMRECLGGNFLHGMMALGYTAAAIHYQQIIAECKAFPILNFWGNPGTGKSVVSECALSLIGMHIVGMMREVSVSAAYERLKYAGALLHCLDDPPRNEHLDEFLKGLYNGQARIVRGREASFNVQKPHSPLMVTSNFSAGDTNAATMSRILSVWMGSFEPGSHESWFELGKAKERASGGLPELIALGFPRGEIESLEMDLGAMMPDAHKRVAKSLSLVLWYALAVARIAGMDLHTQLMNYAVEFADSANGEGQSGSYLHDFMEKVEILQSEDKVGEWNLRKMETPEGDAYAIYLKGVWNIFDKEYRPQYNRKTVESLLKEKGATAGKQRFHQNESVSKQYRASNQRQVIEEGENYIPPGPCPTAPRNCLIISQKQLSLSDDMEQVEQVEQVEHGSKNPCDGGGSAVPLIQLDKLENGTSGTEQGISPSIAPLCSKNDELWNRETSETGTGETLATTSTQPRVPFVPLVPAKKQQTRTADSSASPTVTLPPAKAKIESGDIVVMDATAMRWTRGSGRLPKGSLTGLGGLECYELFRVSNDRVSLQLQCESKVIGLSPDGKRVKVTNISLGVISVFSIEGVHVVQKRDAAHANG